MGNSLSSVLLLLLAFWFYSDFCLLATVFLRVSLFPAEGSGMPWMTCGLFLSSCPLWFQGLGFAFFRLLTSDSRRQLLPFRYGCSLKM